MTQTKLENAGRGYTELANNEDGEIPTKSIQETVHRK
jgi:hypothetical protein